MLIGIVNNQHHLKINKCPCANHAFVYYNDGECYLNHVVIDDWSYEWTDGDIFTFSLNLISKTIETQKDDAKDVLFEDSNWIKCEIQISSFYEWNW